MRAPLHASATDCPLPKFGIIAEVSSPGERPGPPQRAPMLRNKTIRLIVPIKKLESLTIDATADRDETDRRIVHPLSGRALLDRNSLPRWPANEGVGTGGGRVRVYASRPPDQTPGSHQRLLFRWSLRVGHPN